MLHAMDEVENRSACQGIETLQQHLQQLVLLKESLEGGSDGPMMRSFPSPEDGANLPISRWFQIGIVSFGYKFIFDLSLHDFLLHWVRVV